MRPMGAAKWEELIRRLVPASIETDNFYRNMVRCLDLGLPWIVHIGFLRLVNDSRSFLPKEADSRRASA
jgi:hypothetical protein